MAFLEKSNWITLIISVRTLPSISPVVAPQVLSRPISESGGSTDALAIAGFVVANAWQCRGRASTPRADASDDAPGDRPAR